MPLTSPISKLPFMPTEKRTLTIRAERIDPKYLTDGEPPSVEAEYGRTERHPTHEARFYEIQGLGTGNQGPGENNLHPTPHAPRPVFVQLNHGDPAADEARLAVIAEDFLSPQPTAHSLQPEGDKA